MHNDSQLSKVTLSSEDAEGYTRVRDVVREDERVARLYLESLGQHAGATVALKAGWFSSQGPALSGLAPFWCGMKIHEHLTVTGRTWDELDVFMECG